MSIYRFADLNVKMQPRYDLLISRAEKYKIENDAHFDLDIDLTDEKLESLSKITPKLPKDYNEYIWYGANFYKQLLKFDGFLLHASAVCYDNKAYVFSAPCGTGKSTHTSLWEKYLGDKVFIINDDKPAIRLIDDKFIVYGTPFSGKTDKNENVGVELKGVCFLERGTENEIKRADFQKVLVPILNQTYRPTDEESMEKLLNIIDIFFNKVPIYELKCDISEQAFLTSFHGME